MPTTYQDIIDLTTAESTTIDSVVALLNGVKAQLDDVLSGAKIPPAVQAKVDAIFTNLTSNKKKLDDALAANVPPTP